MTLWLPLARSSRLIVLGTALLVTAGCEPKSHEHRFVGTLADDSERREDDNSPYVIHTISLQEQHPVTVTMRADAFNTYLQVQAPNGAEAATNDDCHAGQPMEGSCVSFTTNQRGTYRIYANSLDDTGRGTYEILVTVAPRTVSQNVSSLHPATGIR